MVSSFISTVMICLLHLCISSLFHLQDGLVYVVGFSGGDDVVHMAGKRENVVTIEVKYPYHHWHYRMLVGMVDVVFGEIDHCPNHPPRQQVLYCLIIYNYLVLFRINYFIYI